MDKEKKIKIAIVEDHNLMREGLVSQLHEDDQIEVVMQARHGVEMLKQLEINKDALPDIAIIDLNMPVMDGFELAEQLQANYPQIRFLVLTAYCSDYNVASMVNRGASGYLLKDCSPTEFRKAIHSIYETGHYYSALATERTFRLLQSTNPKSINITDRQMEFLKLCCTNKRYDEIAAEMGISVNTLEGIRERLFERLGIDSRISLVLFAMKSGIHINDALHPNRIKLNLK